MSHFMICENCDRQYSIFEFPKRHNKQVCDNCYKKDNPYAAYRSQKRQEDETEFLRHRAQQSRERRVTHPEESIALRDRRRADVQYQWDNTVRSCKPHRRNIPVQEADQEVLKKMMMEPCFYCAHKPQPGERVNGLDRLSSDEGYNAENCVPACTVCNGMKLVSSRDAFIGQVRRIYQHADMSLASHARPVPLYGKGESQKGQAVAKIKEDHLTLDEKLDLWTRPCYLCGYGPSSGIDRIDSDGHYTQDNVGPCCFMCNFMKKDFKLADMLGHIARIHAHTRDWVLGYGQYDIYNNEAQAHPILAFSKDGKHSVCFGSINLAAERVGGSQTAISRVLGQQPSRGSIEEVKGLYRGFKWMKVTSRAYRDSPTDQNVAMHILTTARAYKKQGNRQK